MKQFAPLLQPVTGANVGRPISHSSSVPECVKPAAPDSKSVAYTVVGA
ncbi:MAG: hypothetical protein IPF66_22645 [Holophagales bacterium]|nr:hypothetical protein [Holophagales bacterium]